MGVEAAILMGTTGLASAYAQSSAIREQGKYQSTMARINARNADLAARDAMKRGDTEASNMRKQTKQMVGKQRAALAAQGIDVNADTALDIQQETRAIGAMDAITIKNNAFREAMGFKQQSSAYTAEASYANSASRTAATNTLIAGGIQAAGSAYTAYYGGSKGTGEKDAATKTTKKGS